VVTHLVAEGLLEARTGIGTVVAEKHESSNAERTQLLGYEIEQLVVEAKKLGIGVQELVESITNHWKKLGGEDSAAAHPDRGGRRKQ
jgi:GntR family transcriptional regulator